MNVSNAVNGAIRSKEVRVINSSGDQLGVMDTQQALGMADQEGLDLVVISDKSNPPVCRILDYGKFKYEQSKAEKERLKKARANSTETKEIQLRPVTDDHDVSIKAKRAKGFLEDGNRVKVVVRFRGREMAHKDIGHRIIEDFFARVGEHKVETPVNMNGRQMFAVISPVKKSPTNS